MRHGDNSSFSSEGIHIAINYWIKNGHEVKCFMPEYLFDYDEVNKNKRLHQSGMKIVKASKLPNNVSLLHNLADKGYIVKTPSQDYDDSYCI